MDPVYKIALVVMGVMYLEVQVCNTLAESNRGVAPEEALLVGPDGKTKCILDTHSSYVVKTHYVHSDENGKCICTFCRKGRHVKSFCVCQNNSDVPATNTECVPVEIGHYMEQSNFCLEAYNCTSSCAENQIMTERCLFGADIQCQCKEGWFNPNKKDTGIPKDCRKKPSCPNAGEEPLENDDTDGKDIRTFSCKRCRDEHFKKEGDVECKPLRVCEVKAGDQFEDTECLNDIPSVSESPGNTASPVTQATTESTSHCVSQMEMTMPVDHETTYTTAKPDFKTESDARSRVGAWLFLLIVAICLLASVVVNILLYRNIKCLQNKLKKLQDNPAQQMEVLPGGAPGNIRMEGRD